MSQTPSAFTPDPEVRYQAVFVPLNTPYPDEPSEIVPAGWWIQGHHVDEDLESPRLLMLVESAFDADGSDLSEPYAKWVAETLTAAAKTAGSSEPSWCRRCHLNLDYCPCDVPDVRKEKTNV